MNVDVPDTGVLATPRERVLQPCAESCAAFRPLAADRWSEYGICTNPRSRFSGYPVRIGRECRDFQTSFGSQQ